MTRNLDALAAHGDNESELHQVQGASAGADDERVIERNHCNVQMSPTRSMFMDL